MKGIFVRLLFVLFVGLLSTEIIWAQDGASIQNLQNIEVDDLSDDQITRLIQQVESSGYSQDQLEILARARGMSETQIAKLRQRISEVGQSPSNQSGGEEASRLRESPLFQSERGTTFDPFEDIFPRDTVERENLEIFGLSFFENAEMNFEPSLNIATPRDYLIGPGDQLVIDVWGAAGQIYQLDVSPEGSIRVPNLGPIFLNGLTVEKAEDRIISRLKSIYSTLGQNTYAQISLGQIRTISVNVIGEVKRPGTYPMSSFGTAFNALYYAGGPTETGSLRNIQIFRGGEVVDVLDAYNFLIYGKGQDLKLQDNDVVLVNPYENRVKIEGEVKRPAYYEMLDGETLSQALKFAGGYTADAYTKSISVRRNLDNRKTVQTVKVGFIEDFSLKGGDAIDVGRIQNQFIGRVRIEGAVNHPGEFELIEGMKLSDLISVADGLRSDAFLERGIVIRQNDDLTLSNIAFNLKEVNNGSVDFDLKSEDLIRIQSKFDLRESYTVSIRGEVITPGTFPFAEGMTVENLIYLANGFKETAARSFVEVARRTSEDDPSDNSAKIFNFEINGDLQVLDNGAGFELQPFDLVVIRESPYFERQLIVEVEGEVTYPGDYVLESRTERVSDVLRRTGGLTKYAYPEGATLIRRTEYFNIEDDEVIDESVALRIKREELESLFDRDTAALDQSEVSFKEQESIGIRLADILKDPGSKYDLILKEGDIISIPRELQTIRIRGEVLYSSTVRYDNTLSFKRIVSQAGGFTGDAMKRKAYVIYANGSAEQTRSFLWFKDYPKVAPGAEVIIPEKPQRQRLSPQAVISITSGVATLSLVLLRILDQL